MSNIKEILNRSSVFGSLEHDDIKRLAKLFLNRQIQPGDVLANAKDAAQFFFLLDKGSVLLAMEDDKSLVLNTSGDFIGMELLSAKGIYKTTLSVLEKGNIFAVPRQDFLILIQEDSNAASAIMTSWQDYLEQTAPFAKNIDNINLQDSF